MQEREKKPFPTTVFYTVVTYQHSAKKKKKRKEGFWKMLGYFCYLYP